MSILVNVEEPDIIILVPNAALVRPNQFTYLENGFHLVLRDLVKVSMKKVLNGCLRLFIRNDGRAVLNYSLKLLL